MRQKPRWILVAAAALGALASSPPASAGETAGGGKGDPAAPGAPAEATLLLRQVERRLEESPGDLELRLRRQELLVALGRRTEALREAREGFEAAPEDPAACTLYAPLLSDGAARRLYEKAVGMDPGFAPAWRGLARLHEERERWGDAASAMERAVALEPSAGGHNRLGWFRERAGLAEDAERSYRAALAADGTLALARENLALLLAGRGAAEEALEEARRTVRDFPRRSASWVVLGLVRARRREFGEAAAAYEKALAVSPDDRAALLGLARSYRQVERWDLAVRALDRAEGLAPGDPGVLVQRGLLAMDRGRTEEAEEQFRRAAKEAPRDARPRHLLGLLLERAGRAEEALREFRRAVSLDRDSGILQLTLAQALERGGDFREALRGFRRAADLLPDDPRPLVGEGAVLQKLGRVRDAVARYEEAAAMDPPDRALHRTLGILYADSLRDREKADRHFARYLELGGAAEVVRPWYDPAK